MSGEIKSSTNAEVPTHSDTHATPTITAKVRKNPWILATLVLGAVLLVLVFGQLSGGISGGVSKDVAAENLVDYLNTVADESVTFVSVSDVGSVYLVTVSYQGEEIPLFVTKDGANYAPTLVPLTDSGVDTPTPSQGSTGTPSAKVTVNTQGAPMKGSASATITLVEFSDYECPFCGRHFTQTYPSIIKNYVDTGKVKFYFMNYPLNFHPNAQKSAEAALCVKDQKGDTGYFTMHDKLYSNQDALSIENYKKWAREVGANGAQFDTCLDSGKFAKQVTDDLAYGQQIGVSGTPGFFINGRLVSGACPYSAFQTAFDAELAGKEWSVNGCTINVL